VFLTTTESVTDRSDWGLPFYPQINGTFRGYLVDNTPLMWIRTAVSHWTICLRYERHASLAGDPEEGFIPPRKLLPSKQQPMLSLLFHTQRQATPTFSRSPLARASLPVQPHTYITGPSRREEASHNKRPLAFLALFRYT
jgi:hypothetical protein